MKRIAIGFLLVAPLLAQEEPIIYQVTTQDQLAVAQATSNYWQAMYQLQVATGQVQDLVAGIRSRCEQSGGSFQASGMSIACVAPQIEQVPNNNDEQGASEYEVEPLEE